MAELTGILIPLLIIVAVALILWYVVERFAPDPLIANICKVVIFIVALIAVTNKLLPLLH